MREPRYGAARVPGRFEAARTAERDDRRPRTSVQPTNGCRDESASTRRRHEAPVTPPTSLAAESSGDPQMARSFLCRSQAFSAPTGIGARAPRLGVASSLALAQAEPGKALG